MSNPYTYWIAKLREIADSPSPVERSGDNWLSGIWPRAGRFLCPLMENLYLLAEWRQYHTERWPSLGYPFWWSTLCFPTQAKAIQATEERAEVLRDFANWLEARYESE